MPINDKFKIPFKDPPRHICGMRYSVNQYINLPNTCTLGYRASIVALPLSRMNLVFLINHVRLTIS